MTGLEFHDKRTGHTDAWFVDADPVLPMVKAAWRVAVRQNVGCNRGVFRLSAEVARRLEDEVARLDPLGVRRVAHGGTMYGYPVEVVQ